MVYSIYVPPCYAETNRDYPVLYLFHGSNSTNQLWLDLGLPAAMDAGIASGDLPPFVVVMPYGGWMANENRFDNLSWENVFLTELMPNVEANLRVTTIREGRAIGGISRGGFWAYQIAFRHPDLFRTVGGHSAFFDEGHRPLEFNPLHLAQTAAGLDMLRIWLDRGRDDYAQFGFDQMHERLMAREIAHEYTVYPVGEHNNAYWSAHIAEYLAFYAAEWEAQSLTPDPSPEGEGSEGTPEAVTIAPQAGTGLSLFLPAVAFQNLQTTIDSEQLYRVANGELDAKLVVSQSAADQIRAAGIPLDPLTRTVPDADLLALLWNSTDLYTLLPPAMLTPRYRVLNIGADGGEAIYPLDMDAYPLTVATNAPNFDPSRLTRIAFSGVTALARNTLTAIDANSVQWAGEGILPYVTRPDYFHISNEVSFAPRCPESDEPVLGGLCSKDAHFELFTMLDVDLVELTGNHNNDYGYNVYNRTLGFYQEADMLTVGGGETLAQARQPILLTQNGIRIGILACNWNGPDFALVSEVPGDERPGATYCEMAWLREAIPALAAETDVVIVSVQYAEYDRTRPIDRQVNDFHALADLGADVVLGSQAHRPQQFEFYPTSDGREAFIHYGLGNLFFDQPVLENRRFFIDQLFIYEGRLLTVDLFTGIIDDFARPRPMTAEEQAEFLEFMFVEFGERLTLPED